MDSVVCNKFEFTERQAAPFKVTIKKNLGIGSIKLVYGGQETLGKESLSSFYYSHVRVVGCGLRNFKSTWRMFSQCRFRLVFIEEHDTPILCYLCGDCVIKGIVKYFLCWTYPGLKYFNIYYLFRFYNSLFLKCI